MDIDESKDIEHGEPVKTITLAQCNTEGCQSFYECSLWPYRRMIMTNSHSLRNPVVTMKGSSPNSSVKVELGKMFYFHPFHLRSKIHNLI